MIRIPVSRALHLRCPYCRVYVPLDWPHVAVADNELNYLRCETGMDTR